MFPRLRIVSIRRAVNRPAARTTAIACSVQSGARLHSAAVSTATFTTSTAATFRVNSTAGATATATAGSVSGPVSLSRLVLSELPDASLRGRTVFVRVDFNVPQNKKDGSITDDARIRESLPTIERLSRAGARVVLASHLGRPSGVDPKLRMKPIAERLGLLLAKSGRVTADAARVIAVPDCVGAEVSAAVKALKDGSICCLENVRFHAEEEVNDSAFARRMAVDTGAELYVNDAFGTAHRAHASTAGIRAFISGRAAAGNLMSKELKFLGAVRDAPAQPLAAILGGAKVSDKIKVIESLTAPGKARQLVIGGAMAFPFVRLSGFSVGASKCDDKHVPIAKRVLDLCRSRGVELVTPIDFVVAQKVSADAETRVVPSSSIPDGWFAVDIGPKTIRMFQSVIESSETIFWNGPMGVFEMAPFSNGTFSIARAMADASTKRRAVTIIGGGDSAAAVVAAGASVASAITHISTGGGASLELLEGAAMPGIAALDPRPTSV